MRNKSSVLLFYTITILCTFIFSFSPALSSSIKTKEEAQGIVSGGHFCEGSDEELKKHFENTAGDKEGKSYFYAASSSETLEQFKDRLKNLTVKKCVSNKQQTGTTLCYAETINGIYNGESSSTEAVILINNALDCIYNAHPAKM